MRKRGLLLVGLLASNGLGIAAATWLNPEPTEMLSGLGLGALVGLCTVGMARARGNTPAVFSWLALVPKRIWNEDVGDALETICAMERAGCSQFKIRLKVVTTYCWVIIITIREMVTTLIKVPLR